MRIGIDLGGTKTEIICLNKDNGKELYSQRVPTPKGDYKATIHTIKELVERSEETIGEKGTIGIGIPGTVSQVTGLVKNANATWLNGNPLDKDLEEAIGRPVRVQNDANCFAVSEATDGSAAGKNVVFGVIIGTGGEWGHNPLPLPHVYSAKPADNFFNFDHGENVDHVINPTYAGKERPEFFTKNKVLNEYPGPQCYCGKRGCLETWISGTGFKNDYHRVTGEDLSTTSSPRRTREMRRPSPRWRAISTASPAALPVLSIFLTPMSSSSAAA